MPYANSYRWVYIGSPSDRDGMCKELVMNQIFAKQTGLLILFRVKCLLQAMKKRS